MGIPIYGNPHILTFASSTFGACWPLYFAEVRVKKLAIGPWLSWHSKQPCVPRRTAHGFWVSDVVMDHGWGNQNRLEDCQQLHSKCWTIHTTVAFSCVFLVNCTPILTLLRIIETYLNIELSLPNRFSWSQWLWHDYGTTMARLWHCQKLPGFTGWICVESHLAGRCLAQGLCALDPKRPGICARDLLRYPLVN